MVARYTFWAGLWAGLAVGCGEPEVVSSEPLTPPSEAPSADAPPAIPPHGATAGAAGGPASTNAAVTVGVLQGVILEIVAQGTSKLVRLDVCGVEMWVSGPDGEYTKGQTLAVLGGRMATDVEVAALGKTLPSVVEAERMAPSSKPMDCGEGAVHGVSGQVLGTAPPPVAESERGKVLETMDSGGYTYVLADKCGVQRWMAGPTSEVKVGQTIAVTEGGYTRMTQFQSKTLGRTFETIDFLQAIQIVEGEPNCP